MQVYNADLIYPNSITQWLCRIHDLWMKIEPSDPGWLSLPLLLNYLLACLLIRSHLLLAAAINVVTSSLT